MYRLKIILLSALCAFSIETVGQSISPTLISSAGSQTLFQDVNIHWSVGEVAVAHNTTGVNVSEGFHQANLIATSVLDVKPYFGVVLFPNPTTENVDIRHSSVDNLSLKVYQSDGQLLLAKSDISNALVLDLSMWLPGIYIVSFSDRYGHIESHRLLIQQ